MFMWITNREKLWRHVMLEMLPHWGLQHVATWVSMQLWLRLCACVCVREIVCMFALLCPPACGNLGDACS